MALGKPEQKMTSLDNSDTMAVSLLSSKRTGYLYNEREQTQIESLLKS